MKITKKFIVLITVLALFSSTIIGCAEENEGTNPFAPTTTKEAENPTNPTIPTAPTIPIVTTAAEPATEEPTTEAPTTEPVPGDIDLSKYIALTFDDGPDMRKVSSTNRILDVLEEYGCKATFFVQTIQLTYPDAIGDGSGLTYAQRNKKTVQREHDLGMEIGSHSYDHPNFNKLSDDEIQAQIDKSCSMIKEITGEDVKIIRTPGGAEKQNVLDAVGMPIILWDIDTNDWDTKDADNTYNHVLEHVRGGSIVLMHDIYSQTADAVEMLVPELVSRGYHLVTVSELFRLYGKEMLSHHRYYSAR